MFSFLFKDYNRHSCYNMAVTFFRIAVVTGAAALIFLLLRLTYTPKTMKEEGTHTFTVTKLEKHTYHHRRSTTTAYNAICVDENGGSHNQKIDSALYSYLKKGQSYTCATYSTEGGAYYISWKNVTDPKQATKDFYSINPDSTMIVLFIITAALGVLTLVNVMIGLTELRRERKFAEDTLIMRRGFGNMNQYK
ncbi:MAG: hypothetical protein IKP47_04515 [Ruminococcus sp.]|nr:hypothetical protein [Ruminococcus sp.]